MSELGCCGFFADFFDKQHVLDSLNILRKPRPGHRRSFLILLLIAMSLYTFQRDENQYMYMYSAFKFKWNFSQYSTFKTVKSSAYVVAMLLCVPIMNKLFKWKDTVRVTAACTKSHQLI